MYKQPDKFEQHRDWRGNVPYNPTHTERGYSAENINRSYGDYQDWQSSAQAYAGARQPRYSYNENIGNRQRSMNFEAYASEGNRFINDVAEELQCDRNTASRITRAVLHALRDRLPADDAVEFAQGLPMALKGIYIDQYDISRTPVIIRTKHDFIDYIRSKDRLAAINDFRSPADVVQALQAVFHVLENHMDPGQVDQVKNLLHSEIVELIDGY